jgi:hypothetical protein
MQGAAGRRQENNIQSAATCNLHAFYSIVTTACTVLPSVCFSLPQPAELGILLEQLLQSAGPRHPASFE